MDKINYRRALQAGLVAGALISVSEYVLNEIVFREEIGAVLSARNLPPIGNEAIAVFVLLAFILGLVLVGLYAAILPRFGSGAKSAMISAAVVWSLAYFWSSALYCAIGLFPPKLFFISSAWGFLELSIAALIGDKVYSRR